MRLEKIKSKKGEVEEAARVSGEDSSDRFAQLRTIQTAKC